MMGLGRRNCRINAASEPLSNMFLTKFNTFLKGNGCGLVKIKICRKESSYPAADNHRKGYRTQM